MPNILILEDVCDRITPSTTALFGRRSYVGHPVANTKGNTYYDVIFHGIDSVALTELAHLYDDQNNLLVPLISREGMADYRRDIVRIFKEEPRAQLIAVTSPILDIPDFYNVECADGGVRIERVVSGFSMSRADFLAAWDGPEHYVENDMRRWQEELVTMPTPRL